MVLIEGSQCHAVVHSKYAHDFLLNPDWDFDHRLHDESGLDLDRTALHVGLTQDWLAGAEYFADQHVIGPKPLQGRMPFPGLLGGAQDNLIGLRILKINAGLLGVRDVGGRLNQAGQNLVQVVEAGHHPTDLAQHPNLVSTPAKFLA